MTQTNQRIRSWIGLYCNAIGEDAIPIADGSTVFQELARKTGASYPDVVGVAVEAGFWPWTYAEIERFYLKLNIGEMEPDEYLAELMELAGVNDEDTD